MKDMCLYRIQSSPYLAVSNVYKKDKHSCLIQDTHGKLKKVFPICVVPFDADKFFMFGALASTYCQKDNHPEDNMLKKSYELFGLVPAASV